MNRPVGGVRIRTSAAATAAVAIFLAVAAVAFAFAQREQLENSLTDSARQQAQNIAAKIERDGANSDLGTNEGDQSLVQVISSHRIRSRRQPADRRRTVGRGGPPGTRADPDHPHRRASAR